MARVILVNPRMCSPRSESIAIEKPRSGVPASQAAEMPSSSASRCAESEPSSCTSDV